MAVVAIRSEVRSKLFRVLLALWLISGASCAVSAQGKVIWEIGQKDQSAKEFQKDSRRQLAYDVRGGDWKRDWAATQDCGTRYEIAFEVGSSSTGGYVLQISALTFTPVVPVLHLAVN